ncbi:galactokinase [Ostertagia ostertagi]
MKKELETKFKEIYGAAPAFIFFCPGRVNLIGEHIDYNGGQVMPCAISLGTYVAINTNDSALLRFRSLDFSETAELPLEKSYTKKGKAWFNYPLGVINELLKKHSLGGLDMLFYGNLPIGAGLSSSASIEVLMTFALDTIYKLGVGKKEAALLSQKVENTFIGVNCGIMDQFAVAMGQEHKAILLNCDTLAYQYLPLNTGEYILAIINSNKQRTLADSKYNERFSECRAALKALKQNLKIDHLCDISVEVFENHRHLINDAVLEKRALHVVSENERVHKAKEALSANDLIQFGRLMYESHQSLKELYEVSGKELDTIVEFAESFDGCIGARMTGAGFGGCAIALVAKERMPDFEKQLKPYYREKIGYDPAVFASEVGDGVRAL